MARPEDLDNEDALETERLQAELADERHREWYS